MITKNNRQASCVILLILIVIAPPTLKGMTDKMPLKRLSYGCQEKQLLREVFMFLKTHSLA